MKIEIIVNKADFEYDIFGLVQAFYPREEIEIVYDVADEDARSLPYQTRNHRRHREEKGRDKTGKQIASTKATEEPDEQTDSTKATEEPDEQTACDKPDRILRVEYLPGQIHIAFAPEGDFRYDHIEKLPSDWPEDPAHDKTVRPEMKNILKMAVYDILSEETGKTLPWGTLTGIRPTKIPLRMVQDGASDQEISIFMKEHYKSSDEKIAIATEIAHREAKILSGIDTDKGYSIYIGIPFCPTTCLYCSFPSYARASFEGQVDAYLAALEKEIRFTAEAMKDHILDTVYMGGGTPTSLSAAELDRLFRIMDEALPMDSVKEFTVEAGRPDSIDREKLQVMKKHKVSRISVNPQTMHDKTLKLIGRHHTAAQLVDAFQMAREEGFDDINMDLILGLPGETVDDVRYTLDKVKEMAPDNLTIHSLAIKSKSRLNQQWEDYRTYAMENSDELMSMSLETAAALGLEPYYLYRQKNMIGNLENVGFSKPHLAGLYNILIMEEVESIIALGAGTSSKYVSDHGRNVKRTENVKDIPTYIDRIDEMIGRKKEAILKWL